MTSLEALLVAQAVASGMMAGIIWFVQVVHYPLFAAVTGPHDSDYARANQARTSLVVLPPMLVEAAAAGWLAAWPPAERPRRWRHCEPLAPSAAGKWERSRWRRWLAGNP